MFVRSGGKKSKAQKRREQKDKKERERDLRILEEEETNKKGARHIEAEKLKRLLAHKNQVAGGILTMLHHLPLTHLIDRSRLSALLSSLIFTLH